MPPPSTVTEKNSDSSTTTTASQAPAPSQFLFSSCRFSEFFNYLCIALLISLSKEPTYARAHSPVLLPQESSRLAPTCPAPDPTLNSRPVIGILSHPGDGASGRLNNSTEASYIAASYVKFVESAGARVIPLIYNEPPQILFNKLNMVNGVIFTRRWANSGLYYETVEEIFEKILEKNDAGDHFPLLAICLGFELLTMIISRDKNILETFSAANQASTLEFMQNTNIEGTVFQRFPPDLLKKLTTYCLAMQNHHYGVSPKTFEENTNLSGFFKILMTSVDEDGKAYVSTVQAQGYPVAALQWHPE